jgi:hypothetical protein
MRKITAFYAWQSDTPEKFNRHLIRIALEEAATRISADSSLQVELRIDYDTEGLPGTPPISDSILAKIVAAEIFIPDVTFVARTDGGKLVPNPNVMTEYGYALRAKTHSAMMPVMNIFFGPPEALPFDMGHLRHPHQYNIDPSAGDGERRQARQGISEKLECALRLQIAATTVPPPPPKLFARAEPKDGPARFRSPGEPIGNHWDSFPFRQGSDQPISMASGPAIWLRLMPAVDPGRTWESYELDPHILQTGSLDLAPFCDSGIHKLRAHDGVAICSLLSPQSRETMSLAFLFETGEIWSVDTAVLHYSQNSIPFLEAYYEERLQDYTRLLAGLGMNPPYRWIAGTTGVKDRHLQVPVRQGYMRIPGWEGPKCLMETISEEGSYDGKQTPTSALLPFFKLIFAKCGMPRPDHLPR